MTCVIANDSVEATVRAGVARGITAYVVRTRPTPWTGGSADGAIHPAAEVQMDSFSNMSGEFAVVGMADEAIAAL